MNTTNYSDQSKWPAIYGVERGMTVSEVSDINALKNEGGAFDGASALLGDKWEFPTMDKMVVKRQLTRAGGNNTRILVLAERTRNGKTELAWFNMNSLMRQDYQRNAIYPKWYDLPSVYARMERLAGKTITIDKTEKFNMQKFENGMPVEGACNEQPIAIVPFV